MMEIFFQSLVTLQNNNDYDPKMVRNIDESAINFNRNEKSFEIISRDRIRCTESFFRTFSGLHPVVAL